METSLDDGHEQCRKNVHVVCYRKGSQPLSVTDIKSIKKIMLYDYDFPSAICSTCSNALCQERKDETYNLPCLIDDYEAPEFVFYIFLHMQNLQC